MRYLFAAFTTSLLVSSLAVNAQPPRPDDPNLVRAREHYAAGWDFMRAEAFDRAAAEFQLATDFNPKFALAWYGLGRAHMSLRKYQQALLNLEECQALFMAEVSNRFTNRMDTDRARRDRMLELEQMKTQHLKGAQTDQSRDMVRLIENEMRITGNNLDREFTADFQTAVPAFVSLSLGSAYFRKERFVEAERAYKAAIKADDTAAAAHNNLAVIYLMQGRQAQALEHIRLAEGAGFPVDPELKSQAMARAELPEPRP